jgi:hypothetical protein
MAVVVAGGEGELDRMLEEVRGIVESDPEVYLTRWDPQILEGLEGAPEDMQEGMSEDER